MPLRFNFINNSFDFIPDQSDSAKRLEVIKIAGESFSALKLVRLVDSESVLLADKAIYDNSIVLGVSLNAASIGNDVTVLVYGILEDPFFNFSPNELLFLGDNGEITNINSLSGNRTIIGHGLGAGAIMVKIQETIQL